MRILIVDDDTGSRDSVARFLKAMKHQVTQCDNAKDAIALIRTGRFTLVFSDIKMPEMSGIDLLREAMQLPAAIQLKVVLFTGHGTMETAIEALRLGAYDYLLKPVKAEELVTVINKILVHNAENTQSHSPRKPENGKDRPDNRILLGDGTQVRMLSVKMQQVVAEALKYHTDRSVPVLIQGETGTGKELIARLIHDGGNKTARPFIDINCAAIQPGLFESELFGYKAGSFSGGMSKDQKGKFDAAQGGTIFLDEVAEIPIELQAKLLRVVQEKEYYRVGGAEKIAMDARIICATNVNLPTAVKAGKFRADLYYRLQVGQIMLPPLRERKEDIVILATGFLSEFSQQRKKSFKKINSEAKQALIRYNWPGNVRELKNIIEWIVLMHDDIELEAHHFNGTSFPTETEDTSTGLLSKCVIKGGSIIESHVNHLVEDSLKKFAGNKAAAARYLGISRRSLYRLLEKTNTQS